jgi:hypothetical protein
MNKIKASRKDNARDPAGLGCVTLVDLGVDKKGERPMGSLSMGIVVCLCLSRRHCAIRLGAFPEGILY